jgi:hypothetical protein
VRIVYGTVPKARGSMRTTSTEHDRVLENSQFASLNDQELTVYRPTKDSVSSRVTGERGKVHFEPCIDSE